MNEKFKRIYTILSQIEFLRVFNTLERALKFTNNTFNTRSGRILEHAYELFYVYER